jgi:ABC-type transport system involved in multi-copper enzyme maturation permease subunit
MLTGTLAMLHRALRLDARLVRTHVLRLLFALLMYVSLIVAHAQSQGLAAAPGLNLLEWLSWSNMVLIALAGVSFFATAISEEKEEETLGLLKMAGINPLGLLLGKSTSRLVGTLLLLAVQFPFTLLAITLGGATLTQVVASYCTLAAFLALAANMGLFCSVVFRRAGFASTGTAVLLLAYLLGGQLLLDVLASPAGAGGPFAGSAVSRLLDGFHGASALWQMQRILGTGFDGPVLGFQVQSNLAAAAVFFVASWITFPYFTRDARVRDSGHWLHRAWRTGRGGVNRPGRHALLWKEYHFVTGGHRAQLVKFAANGALAAFCLWGGWYIDRKPIGESSGLVVACMLALLVFESAVYASRIFHDEWRDHTLPLLMLLPVSTSKIAISKILGCLPALIPATAWLVAGLALWDEGPEHLARSLVSPSYWFYGLVYVLFLTLTAFFSLVVRWGALPLAIGVMLAASSFGACCVLPFGMQMFMMGGNDWAREGVMFVVDPIVALLIAGLQFDIHRRLELTAAR